MIADFIRAFVLEVRALEGAAARMAGGVAQPVEVEPTVVSFRPLPTATRHPPWDRGEVIVDDLGPPPARRERRDR